MEGMDKGKQDVFLQMLTQLGERASLELGITRKKDEFDE